MTRFPALVLGASGTTGRRVAARLAERGLAHRAASRSTVPRFDWLDRGTWDAALAGSRSVYLVPLDGEVLTRPFLKHAAAAGVRRVVLLSGRGVDVPGYTGEETDAGSTHIDGEDALRSSSLEWTLLRPSWFAQNFSEGFFADAVRGGRMRFPAGDGAATFVDAEDIADVAVAALTEDRHLGQTYELSGPRAVSLREAADRIAEASGKPLDYTPVPVDRFLAELVESGWDADAAHQYAAAFHPLRNDLDSHYSDGVERALGRSPRSFEQFAAGAWKR